MDRGDVYFMEHLHLMFNKPNLLRMRGIDGQPFVDAYEFKTMNHEMLDKKEIEVLIERLRQLFKSFSGGTSKYSSITLEQLKDKIRKKVKEIIPR